jgi:hypothetical protein
VASQARASIRSRREVVDAGPRAAPERLVGRDFSALRLHPASPAESPLVQCKAENEGVVSPPTAASGEKGPFHSSPGAGACELDCDDEKTSTRRGSHCTPKVTDEPVHEQACALGGHPEALNATYFSRAGIALHFYPSVPDHPASHGCVRLVKHASELIYDNARTNLTTVTVSGTWKRGTHPKTKKPICW